MTQNTKNKMNATSSNEIEITARAKAFSCEGVKEHKFLVCGQAVKVWDRIAGHYTNCHSLTTGSKARIIKLARNAN